MISFSTLDIAIIILFFFILLLVGFIFGKNEKNNAESFLLSNRNIGLTLFVLTNVSTWYGGILGVGEFVYRYGLLNWLTQGIPYYIFAFLFAIFLAKKIRESSLYTIPDKLRLTYGNKVGLLSALLIFILVSPAPYILMIGNLISIMFNLPLIIGILIGVVFSLSYLIYGGYKADVYTDVFLFFIMFIGFFIIVFVLLSSFGGIEFLTANLPASHLKLTGDASVTFIIVWFLLALWTFADPGFHQRTYAAKDGNTAVKGILISIILWIIFDFFTNTTGLFARAILPNLQNPVLSYPLLADKILSSGLKGLFFIALFATIFSTSNSFFFLSGTTLGRDIFYNISEGKDESKIKSYSIIGLIITAIISIVLAMIIPSVIQLWYTLGSICIPGLIILIISAYYPKFKVNEKLAFVELIVASLTSFIWFLIREFYITNQSLKEIEPMLIGLFSGLSLHIFGMIKKHFQ
ncbi:MAG: sodium:solute symporter family protein [Ignavibacterium sp.]